MRRRSKTVTWPEGLAEFVEERWLDVPLASVCGQTAAAWSSRPGLRLPESKRAIWRRALAWEAFAEARRAWLDEHLPVHAIEWDLVAAVTGQQILRELDGAGRG